jgi:hypothetical protein
VPSKDWEHAKQENDLRGVLWFTSTNFMAILSILVTRTVFPKYPS